LYGSDYGPVKDFFHAKTQRSQSRKGAPEYLTRLCDFAIFASLRENCLLALLGVVTRAMADFEFFLFQGGICELDRDLAVGAVALFVC